MKSSTLPFACSIAMTAVLSAGLGHWWSVRQFVGLLDKTISQPPTHEMVPTAPEPMPERNPVLAANATRNPSTAVAATTNADPQPVLPQQAAFYQALMEKLARVEGQNKDLLDQLAETNRDLMKLEFRVDTHSESFRPLPVVEETPFSSLDTTPGVLPARSQPSVLPPRAQPIELPSHE